MQTTIRPQIFRSRYLRTTTRYSGIWRNDFRKAWMVLLSRHESSRQTVLVSRRSLRVSTENLRYWKLDGVYSWAGGRNGSRKSDREIRLYSRVLPNPRIPLPVPRPPKRCAGLSGLFFWGGEGRVKRNCKNEVERIGRLRDLRYRNCSHKTPLISSYWHFYTWQNCSTPPPPPPRNHQSYMSFVDQEYVTSGPFLLCQRLLLLNAVVALIFDAFEYTLCKHCTKNPL